MSASLKKQVPRESGHRKKAEWLFECFTVSVISDLPAKEMADVIITVPVTGQEVLPYIENPFLIAKTHTPRE